MYRLVNIDGFEEIRFSIDFGQLWQMSCKFNEPTHLQKYFRFAEDNDLDDDDDGNRAMLLVFLVTLAVGLIFHMNWHNSHALRQALSFCTCPPNRWYHSCAGTAYIVRQVRDKVISSSLDSQLNLRFLSIFH